MTSFIVFDQPAPSSLLLSSIMPAAKADARVRMLVVATSIVFSAWVLASEVRAEEIRWLNETEMRSALHQRVGITWSGRTLRDALQSLSESQRVACWLDRRIDPDQKLDLSTDSAALDAIFREVARRIDAAVGFVGPVVYIGPASTASELWTICELRAADIAKLPNAARDRWLQRRPADWEILSTPQELLQAAAADLGVELTGVDIIPHDLWAAGRFPTLNGVERLTLLLAPFELTFSVTPDGSTVRVERWPAEPRIERPYTLSRNPSVTAESLAKAVPTAVISRTGSRITVRGTAEDHETIARLVRGEKVPRPAAPGPAQTRYTLTIKNIPAGDVLVTLEQRAGLKIEIAPELTEKLKTRVSIDVKEARLEQLLAATLQETGLTFELDGSVLKIVSR